MTLKTVKAWLTIMYSRTINFDIEVAGVVGLGCRSYRGLLGRAKSLDSIDSAAQFGLLEVLISLQRTDLCPSWAHLMTLCGCFLSRSNYPSGQLHRSHFSVLSDFKVTAH